MTAPKAKQMLETYLLCGGFGQVVREYPFVPGRRFRADYYLSDQRPPVIVEYDGLMRYGENQGHASINGIIRDSEKANLAIALGYRYFRGNAKSVGDGSFFELLDMVLEKIDKERTA